MAAVRRWLLAGLLVLVPLAITVWLLDWIVGTLDQTLQILPRQWHPDYLIGFHVPGFGVLLALGIVLLIGAVASNFLGRKLVSWWDALLGRIPIVRSIYSSVKQVSDTLFSENGNAFRKAVLVQWPREGVWTIGFQTGTPGGTCTASSIDSAGGGDCDGDGVPNVVDVDDNGNRILDAVDAVSAATTARLNLFFGLRPSFANQLNVYSGATRASINSYLSQNSGGDGLGMNFFLDQQYLDPGNGTALQNVWLSCTTGQPWCAPGTGTATISGLSDTPPLRPGLARFQQIPWGTYFGASCDTSACTPLTGSDANSLAGVSRQGPSKPPTWIGAVRPTSTDALANVVPGDVLTINTRSASGVVATQPTTISPYFVTSPALASYGPADGSLTPVSYPLAPTTPGTSPSWPIQVDSSGRIKVRLWRPQRFALPGESAEYYDIGGLRWGVSVESYTDSNSVYHQGTLQFCQTSDLVGVTANASANDKVQFTDSSPLDVATDVAQKDSRVLGFTVDVGACLAAGGYPTVSGTKTRITLLAQGAALPGGANETGMSLDVALP